MEDGGDARVARPLLDVGLEHLGQPKLVQRRRPEFPGNEVDVLIDMRQHLQALAVSGRFCVYSSSASRSA